MMKGSGCKNCPVKDCPTLIYRGSFCEALRAAYGLGDPLTNADHIRSMSDEELSVYLALVENLKNPEPVFIDTSDKWMEWLKQPFKENEE